MKDTITLYHYTKIENLDNIIRSHRLKLTEAGLSNDPFEMNPSFDTCEKSPLIMDSHMWNLERCWEEHKAMEPQTVICLSASLSSVLMWGHYAANHTGVCLAFEIPVSEYANCLIANLGKNYPLLPMQYGESRVFAKDYIQLGQHNTIVYSLGSLLRKLLSYKPYDWNYEREFRLLVPQNAIDYDSGMMFTSILKDNLSGVILGAQCKQTKTKVRAMLSSAGYGDKVAVERAKLHSEKNAVYVEGIANFTDMIQHRYNHYKKLEALHTDKEQILTLNIVAPRDWRKLYNEVD